MAAANTLGFSVRRDGADRLAAETRLAELRQKLRQAMAQKKARMKEFVEACKADRLAVRDQVREMRTRSLRDLKDQIQAARGAAKLTKLTRLAEVRQMASGPVERARAAANVEKQHQAELARLAREERARRVEIGRAHERALAASTLRSSLFGKLAPLFERVGRAVTQAPGESRGEALLRYAEQNPEKAHAVLEPSAHRKVEEIERAVDAAERTVRVAGGDVRAGHARAVHAQGVRTRQKPAGVSPLPAPPVGPTRELSLVPSPSLTAHHAVSELASAVTPAAPPALPPGPTAALGKTPKPKAKSPRLRRAPKAGAKPSKKGGVSAPVVAVLREEGGIEEALRAFVRRDAGTRTRGLGLAIASHVAHLARPRVWRDVPRAARLEVYARSEAQRLAARDTATGDDVKRWATEIIKSLAAAPASSKSTPKSKAPKGTPRRRTGARKKGKKSTGAEKPGPPAKAPRRPRFPSVSYAMWCQQVSSAAAKHRRRVVFGAETSDAWKNGQTAEAFVLTQPHTHTPRSSGDAAFAITVPNNGGSGGVGEATKILVEYGWSVGAHGHVSDKTIESEIAKHSGSAVKAAEAINARLDADLRAGTIKRERDATAQSARVVTSPPAAPKLRLVTSSPGAGVKPYKVRASCGHVVVRSMSEATARVPYSESVVLDAPKGRACEACEAKRNFAVHAPRPAEKKDVKAPELHDTAQIAKRIREEIQAAVRAKSLPSGQYSVTTAKYAGGSSIKVVASKLPFPVLNTDAFRVMKGSSDVAFDRDHFRSRYTDKAEAVLAKLNAIVDEYHWDRSDPMTDYFHQRFAREVKLDDNTEWRRMNEAKKTAARTEGHGGEP